MFKWNVERTSNRPTLVDSWDPLTPHDVLFDKLFSKSFPEFNTLFGPKVLETAAYPKIDIRETETQFILDAEINGLTKDQVRVEVKGDTLVIRGDRRNDKKKDGTYHLQEIKRSTFNRSFSLPPDTVNKNTVSAKFNNGVLEISIDKIKPLPPSIPDINVIPIQ